MGRDLAIDLGTANTLVYRQGDGIVFDQPTVVALHGGTGEVLGMGDEVWDLIGGDSYLTPFSNGRRRSRRVSKATGTSQDSATAPAKS